MKSFKSFVLVAVLAVGGIAGVAAIDSPVAGTQRAEAAQKFYAKFTYYKKSNTGIVTKISSGQKGPYDTRREAQSVVDDYNASENRVNGYKFYYIAAVAP